VIYYTTNSTTPTTSSSKFVAPITVSADETIKAMAVASGFTASPIASATYTLIGSPSALAAFSTQVTASGAQMNGVVNTMGLTGTFQFQYGNTSTSLPATTAAVALTASPNAREVSQKLAGLKSGVAYFYRVLVTTAGGTATGAVHSFTTQ
jgi:hypothetical protein